MASRLIRVSSRATGERRHVRVYIYDTIEEMDTAAHRFNGAETDGHTRGWTQAFTVHTIHPDGTMTEKQSVLVVRLQKDHLGTQVVVHEINHAATAIYGSTLDDDVKAVDVLHNANETLAHLQSDLTRALVDRLYELGYYDKAS